MSINSTITQSISTSQGGAGISGYTQAVGNSQITVGPLTFPANSNNAAMTISFNGTTLQQIFLWSDRGCTIFFATGPTIVLQPGSPYLWNAGDGYYPNAFNGNAVVNATVSTTVSAQIKGVVITP